MDAVETTEVLALLRQISAQLEALPKAIAVAQHRGAALTRTDRQALERLLAAISEAIGNAPFTARSIVDDATSDGALGVALELAVGAMPANTRKLGKLLARADGFAVDGFTVRCEAKHKDGLLWRVARV